MTYPPRQTAGMRNLIPFIKENEVIARFGQAELVRNPQGAIELRGGVPAEHTAAREWISLFMHEAVPQATPWAKPSRAG